MKSFILLLAISTPALAQSPPMSCADQKVLAYYQAQIVHEQQNIAEITSRLQRYGVIVAPVPQPPAGLMQARPDKEVDCP